MPLSSPRETDRSPLSSLPVRFRLTRAKWSARLAGPDWSLVGGEAMEQVLHSDDVLRRTHWSRNAGYEIVACENLTRQGSALLATLLRGRRCLICSTPTVNTLYGDAVAKHISQVADAVHILTLPVREADKALSAAVSVIETAASIGLHRRDIIVALGGGVCSDIVRTAASLFRRGVPHICIPTTSDRSDRCGDWREGRGEFLWSQEPCRDVPSACRGLC